ncbi:hypothetical protein CARUB_v10006295mg, partial [Capsella rubella]
SDRSEQKEQSGWRKSNWFPDYVYESPMLDTSDGFESLIPGESECIYETEIKKEITKSESTIDVCHTQVREIDHLIIDESDIEEDYKNTSSLFRKPANNQSYTKRRSNQNRTTTTTTEEEIISLKSRVNYLEDELKKLHDLINSFVSSNTNNR